MLPSHAPHGRGTALLGLTVLLSVSSFSPAFGQTADEWLEKLAASVERAPYSVDYSMQVEASQAGNQMSLELKANLLYGSPTEMQGDMTMKMAVASLPDAMELQMNMVSDGSDLWVEMNNPMMGTQQVLRTPLDRLDEQVRAQTGMPGMTGNLDPFAQIEQLKNLMTFEVGASADGLVTLVGTPTDEFEATLGAAAAMLGGGMRLTIESDTGLPRTMEMGPAGAPVMTMTFENYEFLDASELPQDAFTYTPPEGATVTEPLG